MAEQTLPQAPAPATAERLPVRFAVLRMYSMWEDVGAQMAALRAALVAAAGGAAPLPCTYEGGAAPHHLVCVPEGVALEAVAAAHGFGVVRSHAAAAPAAAMCACFQAVPVYDSRQSEPFALQRGQAQCGVHR